MKELTVLSQVLASSTYGMGDYQGQYIYGFYKRFITAFNDLNLIINGKKRYSEKQIADYVFKLRVDGSKPDLVREFLKRKFYVANEYLKYLELKITEENIISCIHRVHLLISDYEDIVLLVYKYNIIKEEFKDAKFSKTHFRWKVKFPERIYQDACALFNFREFGSIEQLGFYELEPYSIFIMRQFIEEIDKGILGIGAIIEGQNLISKKQNNAPWDFINKEVNKKSESRISVSFDVGVILKIQAWSNNFVHAAVLADIYLVWQAMEILKKILERPKESVKVYSGELMDSNYNPNIIISQYISLKKDFELSLSRNKKGTMENQFQVVWRDYVKYGIEGYITSL